LLAHCLACRPVQAPRYQQWYALKGGPTRGLPRAQVATGDALADRDERCPERGSDETLPSDFDDACRVPRD
jgi:hypothetical protein